MIQWLKQESFSTDKNAPLFPSQKGGRLKRRQALQVIEDAKNAAQLTGKVTSHSCRKTFANRVLKKSGNLYTVKEALGHRSVSTTEQYLSISEEELREAIPEFGINTRNGFEATCAEGVRPQSANKSHVLSEGCDKKNIDQEISVPQSFTKLQQKIQTLEHQLKQTQNEYEGY